MKALHQVMEPIFDPEFSKSSNRFHLGRSAHDAVKQAGEHVCGGRRWVVDLDLEKFIRWGKSRHSNVAGGEKSEG
jgi:RNA-directed DNA polymerase